MIPAIRRAASLKGLLMKLVLICLPAIANGPVADRRRLGLVRKKDKLCLPIHEISDQLGTGYTVDFHPLFA